MKSIFSLLAIAAVLLFSSSIQKKNTASGCEMTVTYAELAYAAFKKAYKASSIEDATPLLKDGVAKASEASAYAISPTCNCDIAKNYSLNAVTFGNKALKTSDLAELKKLTKKAMDMSLDVLTATPNCGAEKSK